MDSIYEVGETICTWDTKDFSLFFFKIGCIQIKETKRGITRVYYKDDDLDYLSKGYSEFVVARSKEELIKKFDQEMAFYRKKIVGFEPINLSSDKED
jgi:hypothetical protein